VEYLLRPDTGLIVWTLVSFLTLVFVLGKFAWKPLIQALRDREEGIRKSVQEAEASREIAEKLKARYEQELSQGHQQVQSLLLQARTDGQLLRETIVGEAQEEARKVMDKTKLELQEETRKALASLKSEVARLSILETEKLLRRSMDRRAQDDFLKEALKDLEKSSRELH
jgi:F-type H+-transporting ATPase subunit b